MTVSNEAEVSMSTGEALTAPDFLDDLLRAKSIAIIGASDDGDKPSGRTIRYLLQYGYTGQIYPINPRRETVQGLRAYSSLAGVGLVPDLAVIVLPADAVASSLEECGRSGVRTVIVFSSGFSEVGGDGVKREQELTSIARRYGIRMLGPNCVGVVNASSGLTAAFMTGLDQDRFNLEDDGIAFVSQSGAMGAFILSVAQASGVGLGRFVSTGNEADITLPEVISQFALDPSTRVVLAYVEGIRDVPRFIAALQLAQQRSVPVVMMKVGRSERGQAAAQSHTGALSGEDAVYDGIMRQYGVIRANSVDELIDAARIFAMPKLPAGPRTAIITLSGGAGVLMSDVAQDEGVLVPELSQKLQNELRTVLPAFASVSNPVDVTGAIVADTTLLSRSLEFCLADQDLDSVMVILGNLEKQEDELITAIAEASAASTTPLVVTWVGGSGVPAKRLSRAGVPVFDEPVRAMKALALASAWPARPTPVDRPRTVADNEGDGGTALLDEHAAKQLLALNAIPVARERDANTADEAVLAATEIGYPVVLKLLSTEVGHKSDLGFVNVGLADERAVVNAAEWMLDAARAQGITDRRLLVQELVRSDSEIILGMRRDEVFGPVVVVGIGGVLAEILRDVQLAVPPITRAAARDMILSLRLAPALLGARGRVPIDIERLIDTIVAFADFALDAGERFESFEINPLLIRADGTPVAVDALGVLAE